ncbi:MAG: DMT family transporter [Xanthobacteraceae bacterium]|nr:DMT family transporter [Xanthobacteraceae bacterium]
MRSLFQTFFGRPYLLLSLTSLFWAGNIVLGRYAAGHVPPAALSFIRWTGAFLILIAFAWPFLKRDWPKIRQHLPVMLVLTFAGITIYNVMAYWGLQYTQAINALLITSAHPLLVAAWSFVLYRERLTIWQTIGIVLSLLGVLTILTQGDLSALRDVRFNIGDVVFFSAQIVYSFYATLIKSRPDISPISFLAFTIGAGAVFLTPIYAAEVALGITFTLDLKAILILAYITIFPSLLAYLFFNRGVELIGPNRAAPFYHLIPIFGSALAIVFLGERPELFHGVGYALVLAGIFIGTRGRTTP